MSTNNNINEIIKNIDNVFVKNDSNIILHPALAMIVKRSSAMDNIIRYIPKQELLIDQRQHNDNS